MINNYYNNEIGDYLNIIQAELKRPISEEDKKALKRICLDMGEMLKEYNNIQGYINNVIKTNYIFNTFGDMDNCISNEIRNMQQYSDDRVRCLQSVINPMKNLNNRFLNARSYAHAIITNYNIPNKLNNEKNINEHVENTKKQDEKLYKVVYILGILMVLMGISIFGKYVYVNYLSDFTKGMMLFAIGIVIILISELFIKKKNIMFSRGITIMGLCELYISVMINALKLHTLNEIIAFILIFLLSIGTIIYSFFEKTIIFRYFAHASGILSFMFFADIISRDFKSSLLVTGYIIILNVLNIVLPIEKKKNVLEIFSIYTLITNCFVLILLVFKLESEVYIGICIFYIILSLLMDKFIFKYLNNNKIGSILNCVFLVYVTIFTIYANGNNKFNENIILGIGIIICIICAILSSNVIKCNYLFPIVEFVLEIVNNIQIDDYNIECLIGYIALDLCIILIGYFKVFTRSKFLTVFMHLEIIGMIISLIICAWSPEVDFCFYLFEILLSFISIIVIMLCQIINNQINDSNFSILKYYSIIFILSAIIKASSIFDRNLILLIGVSICLFNMIFYSNVKGFKNKNYKTDNVLFLTFNTIVSFYMLFANAEVISIYEVISLIVCFITFVIFTKEKYNSVISNYLSKMVLINIIGLLYLLIMYLKIKLLYSSIFMLIVIDVLFMILACFDVYKGFLKKCNGIRIFGVLIAFCTCLKVIIIDCMEMKAIEKTVAFLGIGIIAIIFAYVYSSFVKRNNNIK